MLNALRNWINPASSKWEFQLQRKASHGPVAYIHVPKSAGMSFNESLAKAIGAKAVVNGFDCCLLGGYTKYDVADENFRSVVFETNSDLPDDIDLIGGHFSVATVTKKYPSARLCTVLREPVSRILSHWLYWRQFTDEELAPWGDAISSPPKSARNHLIDFLNDPIVACQIDNVATRMLLWRNQQIQDDAFIDVKNDESIVKSSISVLRKFEFVDFMENQNLVDNVKSWIGDNFSLVKINETKRANDLYPVNIEDELTDAAISTLDRLSRLDNILWKEVVKRRAPDQNIDALRQRIIDNNVAKYRTLQAA